MKKFVRKINNLIQQEGNVKTLLLMGAWNLIGRRFPLIAAGVFMGGWLLVIAAAVVELGAEKLAPAVEVVADCYGFLWEAPTLILGLVLSVF